MITGLLLCPRVSMPVRTWEYYALMTRSQPLQLTRFFLPGTDISSQLEAGLKVTWRISTPEEEEIRRQNAWRMVLD